MADELTWITNADGKIVGCYSIGQISKMTEEEIAKANLTWEKAKKEGRVIEPDKNGWVSVPLGTENTGGIQIHGFKRGPLDH